MLSIACWGDDGSPAAETDAPTLHERCEASCTASSESPCAGQPFDTAGCTSACEAKLAGKSDDCDQCYLGLAGLRGTTCECTTATVGPFSADLACEECTYIGSSRSCGTQLNNKCQGDSKSCQGFQDAELDNPYCAERCGLAVDHTGATCDQACVRPNDHDHPCSGAGTAEVDACRTACVAATVGKSDACQTCYLAKSYWLGTTCDCDSDGTDCTLCNVAASRGGVGRTCIDVSYACNETPQCVGWQSMESACVECGAEAGAPDAGSSDDAGADAGDAGQDASEPDSGPVDASSD
jgi:hypothetical protein